MILTTALLSASAGLAIAGRQVATRKRAALAKTQRPASPEASPLIGRFVQNVPSPDVMYDPEPRPPFADVLHDGDGFVRAFVQPESHDLSAPSDGPALAAAYGFEDASTEREQTRVSHASVDEVDETTRDEHCISVNAAPPVLSWLESSPLSTVAATLVSWCEQMRHRIRMPLIRSRKPNGHEADVRAKTKSSAEREAGVVVIETSLHDGDGMHAGALGATTQGGERATDGFGGAEPYSNDAIEVLGKRKSVGSAGLVEQASAREPHGVAPVSYSHASIDDHTDDSISWLAPIAETVTHAESRDTHEPAPSPEENDTDPAHAPVKIDWTEAFGASDLATDARVALLRRVILIDDEEQYESIVAGYRQDAIVRAALVPLLESLRPRNAVELYRIMLREGPISDAAFAIDEFAARGLLDELAPVISAEEPALSRYALFRLDGLVDVLAYAVKHGIDAVLIADLV